MSEARNATLSFDHGINLTGSGNEEKLPKNVQGLRRTRRARLRISRVDPWSVMKMSLLFSFAFGIIFSVAVTVVWTVIEMSGMLTAINQMATSVLSSPSDQSPVDLGDYINGRRVLGGSLLISAINVAIMTALGTVFAFLYNLSANILGGLEMTLAED